MKMQWALRQNKFATTAVITMIATWPNAAITTIYCKQRRMNTFKADWIETTGRHRQ